MNKTQISYSRDNNFNNLCLPKSDYDECRYSCDNNLT